MHRREFITLLDVGPVALVVLVDGIGAISLLALSM